ncbi:uncharacterized protein BN660_00618 [Clostridium sp. CAG:448]|nr:uncharacterized protein BN660_00618 [Clostridium sp. CAG:448]
MLFSRTRYSPSNEKLSSVHTRICSASLATSARLLCADSYSFLLCVSNVSSVSSALRRSNSERRTASSAPLTSPRSRSVSYSQSCTSTRFFSSNRAIAFSARAASRSSGASWDCTSVKISLTRSILASTFCSLRSASVRRCRNLAIPEASSNTLRRSSLLREMISAIRPCPMMEYPSRPIPVFMNNS